MNTRDRISALLLCTAIILAVFGCAMASLEEGLSLHAFDFGQSVWWDVALVCPFIAMLAGMEIVGRRLG